MTQTLTPPDSTAQTPSKTPLIVLVGNPNIGKSTLFNRLTGLRQRIGNYPGVTVERKAGTGRIGDREVEIIDLPGAYSLAPSSRDEQVVADVLNGRLPGLQKPDLVVFVADASNLKRNLFLASQIADLQVPMVLVLNMMDVAAENGIHIDTELLSSRLRIPIVPMIAARGTGLDELRVAIDSALVTRPVWPAPPWPEAVLKATESLQESIRTHCSQAWPAAVTRRLLFDAKPFAAEQLSWTEEVSKAAIGQARQLVDKSGLHPLAAESLLTYKQLDVYLDGLVTVNESERRVSRSERLDRVLTHRVWGLVVFVALMLVVFQSIYSWSGPLMDLIDAATGAVQGVAASLLAGNPMLQDLMVNGVIGGIGGVIIFLPQLCVLFLFIAVLEDSGYMARAAFLMDRLFSWCGLNGKSFIPMLSSYACAVPGVMATRTIEDPRARLTTILISPLMSCSARLPVYVLLIGAFIEPRYGALVAGIVLFAMHVVGLAIAIPVAWLFNRFILKTKSQPFVLEMPPYRMPTLTNVLTRIWERARAFLLRAGTVILAMSIIIWILLYFPRPAELAETTQEAFVHHQATELNVAPETVTAQLEQPEVYPELASTLDAQIAGAYLEQSYLARMGKTIQPLFAPAGYDWKITVGVLASFPAREVIVATLGIIYNLGGDVDEESGDLRTALANERWESGPRIGQPIFTVPVAASIMVFFALCMQCGATLATIARESSAKWAVVTFVYMTALAWVGAVLTYQIVGIFVT